MPARMHMTPSSISASMATLHGHPEGASLGRSGRPPVQRLAGAAKQAARLPKGVGLNPGWCWFSCKMGVARMFSASSAKHPQAWTST